MITMSVLTTQYVQVPIDTTFNGSPYNPTADVVSMAFMPTTTNANPGVSDWKTASWVTPVAGSYAIRCLVGPSNGGNILTVGSYNIWVKIADNPEVPIEEVGIITII